MSAAVGVVVLNYRTADLTVECLRSLATEIQQHPARVIVADNASGDGSAERIGASIRAYRWGQWASVLALERNGGYAFGNNAGIRSR